MKRMEKLHACGVCGFLYADTAWAAKCEAWCKTHKSCSTEITAHAAVRNV